MAHKSRSLSQRKKRKEESQKEKVEDRKTRAATGRRVEEKKRKNIEEDRKKRTETGQKLFEKKEKIKPSVFQTEDKGVVGERLAAESKDVTISGGNIKISKEKLSQITRADPITKTPSDPAGGWQNVVDVFKIALNPFSKDEIIRANTNIKVLDLIAQGAANNPFTTALYLTGVAGILKAPRLLFGKGAIKKVAEPLDVARIKAGVQFGTPALKVASNTVTKKLTTKLLIGAGFSVAAVLTIRDMASTYPFAKFEIAESLDKIAIARNRADRAGRQDLVDGLNELELEILNPKGWEAVLDKIPYANIQRAAGENIKAAVASTAVFNKILEDERTAREAGIIEESDFLRESKESIKLREEASIREGERISSSQETEREAKERASIREGERIAAAQKEQREASERASRRETERWEKAREEERTADRAAIDFYNEQRRFMVIFEKESKESARIATTAANTKARNEDAIFWAKERAKQRIFEGEDRKAIADFWTAYRKAAQKIALDNRPSNLNFGLL